MERSDRRVGRACLGQCARLSHCGISCLSRVHLEDQTGMTSKPIALILALVLAAPFAAEAQQAGKVYRIGFLRNGPPPPEMIDGFRQGLRELGYIEGQSVTIEYGVTASAD